MFLPIQKALCKRYLVTAPAVATVLSDYTAVLIIRYSFQMYLPVTESTYSHQSL